MKVSYITNPLKIPNIDNTSAEIIKKVSQKFVFRANDYYLNLINWEDENDPIRQLIIPRIEELNDWGKLDASNEKAYTVAKGCQHKYRDTALLLVNEVCGAYCRYCFRKRLFMNDNDEASLDVSSGIEYISGHKEITNILLTGGDPLIMATKKLADIFKRIEHIPHIGIVRIGTKMTAFNPYRILNDPELLQLISDFTAKGKAVYIMNHFDHPRELTDAAEEALKALMKAGAICVNQCPIIKGVNDDAATLAELFRKLSFIGAPQYYLFQGRPTEGNDPYKVSIIRSYEIFEKAKERISGLAKRVKLSMSHETGKIEIIGADANFIFLKYHRAHNEENLGKILIYKRNDEAYWLDDLEPVEISSIQMAG